MTDRHQLLAVTPRFPKKMVRHSNSTCVVVTLTTGINCPIFLTCCQDPAQTVDKQGTGELTALLCLDKVRSVPPQVAPPQESLSDLPGLAAKD